MATMAESYPISQINEKSDKQTQAANANSANRYQLLKTRKVELEKKLNEKYTQLQSILREEAHLTGIYQNDFNSTSTNSNEPSSSPLRRKVGTSFKLPENLLNHNEDDINKLLLEKQIQQQISEASLRLANDSSQTKSIRRTHKQNYEAAQQKILTIDQNLGLMKKRLQHQQNPKKVTQDDINLHKSPNSRLVKGNLMVQTGNSQTLNCNTSLMYMERRNSMKSVSSNNTFIIHASPGSSEAMSPLRTSQNALTTIRTRHDSFSNNNHIEYEAQQSPTLSHYSIQSLHQMQQQMRYQKNMKIRPDQSYSPNHNPQYHHYHTHNQNYSGASQESPQQQQQNFAQRLHNTNYQYSQQLHQQQMALSPSQIHYAQDLLLTTSVHPNNGLQYHQEYSHTQRVSQSHNYSDDMKENNHQLLLQHQMRLQKIANQQQQQQQQHLQSQSQQPQAQQQQGLGGYWTLNENNERVWCHTNDSRYSSLDRKMQMKLKSTSSPNITAKSNSMGNFDFVNKHDEYSHDSVSISSANSNDTKKKEKIWRETSLDGPNVVVTPKTSKVQLINHKIKPSNSTMSLSPKYLSSQMDNINNNNLIYPTSPTSTKSFPNPNHHNSYRNISPTHSLQQQPPPPLPPHLYPKNHQMLSARNSVYSNRDEDIGGHPLSKFQENEIYYGNVDNGESQRPNYYPNLPPKAKLKHTESTRSLQSVTDGAGLLHVDVRGDYENNNLVGNVSPTPTIMSTSTYIPTHSPSLNILRSPDIQTESPKNVTIVQQGKIQPYKEVTKPFEMSDFYKYSTKFRQQTQSTTTLQRQEVHHEQTQKTYYQQSSSVYK